MYFSATNTPKRGAAMAMQEVVTIPEAAARLGGVSHEWVRRLVREGKLEAYRPLPRRTQIILSSLEALINENNNSK